jgi:hypothetical protein
LRAERRRKLELEGDKHRPVIIEVAKKEEVKLLDGGEANDGDDDWMELVRRKDD